MHFTNGLTDIDLLLSRGNVPVETLNYSGWCYYGTSATAPKLAYYHNGAEAFGDDQTADTTTISSNSTGDDAATGQGAWTARIRGVDGSFNDVTEDATLDGQVGVTLANKYLAVNRVHILTSGTSRAAAGKVMVGQGTITSGVPAIEMRGSQGAQPNQGDSAEGAFFTVPLGKTAIVDNVYTSESANLSTLAYRFLLWRDFSTLDDTTSLWRQHGYSLHNGYQRAPNRWPQLILPEKHQVCLRGYTSADSPGAYGMRVRLFNTSDIGNLNG